MKALSIRNPWAWAILHAGKDIENRDWRTNVRGRVLIHAGLKKPTTDELDGFRYVHARSEGRQFNRTLSDLPCGGIVGSVEIVDCVERSNSPWFFGRYGFVLSNPQPLHFIPLKGKLGFFDVPDDLLHGVKADEGTIGTPWSAQ